ncbi:hypothetical protein [Tersicoccus solisilvae]|uniref:hypothetical protein n=1 Tax=Tersicoccus solisilvae TaxID=1882339 RepID=UPI00166E132F|nr:hypothetical protein [Tersicoccus solisilvae]
MALPAVGRGSGVGVALTEGDAVPLVEATGDAVVPPEAAGLPVVVPPGSPVQPNSVGPTARSTATAPAAGTERRHRVPAAVE